MRIFYARTDAVADEVVFSRALELLPESRLVKLSRIKPKESRRQCVVAGLLLEYGLREHGILGKYVNFLENSDGKPYMPEYPKLHYNLSHSGDYVALVMSDGTVGVDIEQLRRNQQRLVERFFAWDEAEWLLQHWSDTEFTRMWTRKEAFLKACGIGMRMPLSGFSVLEEQAVINTKMPLEMCEAEVAYCLKSYQISDEYWLSVCKTSEEAFDIPVEVKIEEILCTTN